MKYCIDCKKLIPELNQNYAINPSELCSCERTSCNCGHNFKQFMTPNTPFPEEVECPCCGNKFKVTGAISDDLEENYDFE